MGSFVRRLTRVSSVCFFLTAASIPLWCQAAPSELASPRIIQAVDETNLTRLRGNTHPMARPEFDRGAAPASLPMKRMLLVLQRSPEQESALRTLLDEQQDKSSPNYHRWLTPEDFGRKFGPADQDIQVVTGWLRSRGFNVARVSKGRTIIEFSGTAGQVQDAFHTAIHKYVVKGEEHWANAIDPKIPAALTPVVAGVHTLHNFTKKPMIRMSDEKVTAKVIPGTGGKPPQVTFPSNPPFHALAPADFATIYHLSGITGPGGVTPTAARIGVVARSNINTGDVGQFYSLFPVNTNPFPGPIVIVDGPDPGDLGGGEEAEAVLDATWSGALLGGTMSQVLFVVSATTNTTDGIDLSELYIVDNDFTDIMTESFGVCEAALQGNTTEIQGITNLAQQAAAQGISYFVASGDSGAEGCDDPNVETVAKGPISVNILASTPYNIAVGGTMFNENGQDSKYWSSTNNQTTQDSALSYIPENVWNESCVVATCGNNANIAAGGGGASAIFSKPPWQASVNGIPNDNARDVPDVSLNAAAGHDPYLLCLAGSCIPDSQGFISLFLVGGTSASTPSFAGIMALVDNATHSRQGQANYVLYRLAAKENLSQCNGSSTSSSPASNCVFNDVTTGNNAVPGEIGSQFLSGPGYDLASGLGSVNIANLANSWNTISFKATTTTIASITPSSLTHGQAATIAGTVTSSSGTPTGTVAIEVQNSQGAIQNVGLFQLSNGSFTGQVLSFPVNSPFPSENVIAHYTGDGTFAPSDSSPFSITVNTPEASTTTESILTLDSTGQNFVPFTGGPYGGFVYLRADVAAPAGHGTPTGSVNFTNSGTTVAGPYSLNAQGNTAPPNGLFGLVPGSYSLVANYSGDSNFSPSSSAPAPSFTITKGTTTTIAAAVGEPQGATLIATVNTSSAGNAPSGNVTFSINGTQVGTAAASQSAGPSINPKTGAFIGVQSIATLADTALKNGTPYTLTATYTGDTNYTQSPPSAPVNFTLRPDFVFTPASSVVVVIGSPGGSGILTLNLAGNDGFNGTVQFNCSGLPAESNCAFSPNTIALSGTTTSAITTLTVTITGPHQVSELESPSRVWAWSIGGSFSLAGIFLVGMPRRPRIRGRLLLLLVFALLLAIVGCGGGGGGSSNPQPHTDPGTPTGSFPVTVTATSGALSHSIGFTLNTP